MSEYRVSILTQSHEIKQSIKFDKKEDAEHFAKNTSTADSENIYDVQKNDGAEFYSIKVYQNGAVTEQNSE
jgi:hypothetical protein